MSAAEVQFHVYQAGETTVVGFDGRHLKDSAAAERCREELLQLIAEHNCQVLVADLREVGLVSSWVLGVLAAAQNAGIQVELYRPSPEIRDVLSVTRLETLLNIRHDRKHADRQPA